MLNTVKLPLQPSSETIWDSKHRLKDEHGTPIDITREDTLLRVAKALSLQEKDPAFWETKFFEIMTRGCIPAGRILSNAGASLYKPDTTLINCVVASNINDSLKDILDVALEVGMTLKTGAGIGMCFSTIRPKGAFVKGVGACFSPETEIFDANFNKISFKDLKTKLDNKEEVYTYSCSDEGVIHSVKIKNCWITKTSNKLIEIELDNNQIIRCTPDHKFMIRTGEYKEAQHLNVDDSMMPIYFHEVEYENELKRRVIKCNKTGYYQYAYHLAGENLNSKIDDSIITDNLHLHHIDFDSLNDYPTNIMMMDSSKHHSIHATKQNIEKSDLSKTLLASNGGRALWNKIKTDPNEYKKQLLENRIGFHPSTWDEDRKNLQRQVAQNTICTPENIKNRIEIYKEYINENPDAFSELQSVRINTGIKNHVIKLISFMNENNIELTALNFNKLSKERSLGSIYILFNSAKLKYPNLFSSFKDDQTDIQSKSKLGFMEKRIQTFVNNAISQLKSENLDVNEQNLSSKISEMYSNQVCSWTRAKYTFPYLKDVVNEFNHSIISIKEIELDSNIDLYDLEVEGEYHNFPLAAGIFAHNCTSGPLSFSDVYDKICFTISSAGGRRGSMMFTFHVFHPDVFDVIKAKREDGRLRQFNISLLITDDFVNAVKNDQPWKLYFPVHKDDPYTKDHDETIYADWPIKDVDHYEYREDGKVLCKVYETISARHLWDEIMKSNYEYGDPGFLLIDKINKENNLFFTEQIIASNPLTFNAAILSNQY